MIRTTSLNIRVRDNFHGRLLGALMATAIDDRFAVWLSPCRSVHTFGMREPLSLLFLDESLAVVHRIAEAWPNRIYRHPVGWSVMEMKRKTHPQLEKIENEISGLSQLIDMHEYANVGRIEACVQYAP